MIIPRQRLSHSTISILDQCERKYQIMRLLDDEPDKIPSCHTSYGTAYGAAIQDYLVHQDEKKALMTAFLSYSPLLEDNKKSLVKCLNAVEASFRTMDELLIDWEVAVFNNVPAIELSFKIEINDIYYYVGYVDMVLKHRYTNIHRIVDTKTTGLELEDLSPLYKNSAQLLGYSIILDAITTEAQSEYDISYFVNQTGRGFSPKIQMLIFHKTLRDRLEWFLSLSMDVQRLALMQEQQFYPKRGDSCLTFNRACQFFNTCSLSMGATRKYKEDETDYQFNFNLDDLITNHLARI